MKGTDRYFLFCKQKTQTICCCYVNVVSTIADCVTVKSSEMMSDLPGSAVSCSRLAVIQEGGESAVWLVWGWAPCPGWAWSRELDSWPVTIAGSSIVQSLPRPLGRPEPQSAIHLLLILSSYIRTFTSDSVQS